MGTYLEGARVVRDAMNVAMKCLTDEQAIHAVALYPLWSVGVEYRADDRVQYGEKLYKCLTAHTAQAQWTPDAAPSLWAKVVKREGGEILPWEQPDNTNLYMQGDKVTHKGKTWESAINNNVWEPGVYGWTETAGSV